MTFLPYCGTVYRDYTVYTENILEIIPYPQSPSWEDCCKRCDDNQQCRLWTFGLANDTNGAINECQLKELSDPEPDVETPCPSFLKIPHCYTGTTSSVILNKLINIKHCFAK